LLAASALVASFLGVGRRQDRLHELDGTGALTEVGARLRCPRSVLFDHEFGQPGGVPETRRRLSYCLDHYHAQNQARIDQLYSMYRIAAGALLAEGILWMIELGT